MSQGWYVTITGGPLPHTVEVTTPGGEKLRVKSIEFDRIDGNGMLTVRLEVYAKFDVKAIVKDDGDS